MFRLIALLCILPLSHQAVDLPHRDGDDFCSTCHSIHKAPNAALLNAFTNANLCLSCHVAGGLASGKALAGADQASPALGLPPELAGSGTSHRWDSAAVGRTAFLGGATVPSSGLVLPSGTFTGAYAKTFTLTITTPGAVGTAQFDWTASVPGGGSGSGILTGTNVPLNEGSAVTFTSNTNDFYQLNDRWQLYVRTDLRAPTNIDLTRLTPGGAVSCSTCHDPHSQANTPFDPQAPPPPSDWQQLAERHYQRIDNSTDQMCMDCHFARAVTNALAGSHPVAVRVATNSFYQPPSSLPLDKPTGSVRCSTCHATHYAAADNGSLLRMTNSTALCQSCHLLASTAASHLNANDNNTLWPGGQYGSLFPQTTNVLDRGCCGNCHQAHGWPDGTNSTSKYTSLLVEREENLCFTCHDGSPLAKDLKTNFTKTYRHPTTDYSGRHSPTEDGNPASYGVANRHAECVDCHNPHQLVTQAGAPIAPAASSRLAGVSRVSVANGAAGTVPVYTFHNALDATPAKEYELCFVCHSSWTTQPTGQSDLGVELNTNNLSYHPVEGAGKNPNINLNAFVNGHTPTETIYCTDCHTSDDTTIRGPHASTNRYILKIPYTASSASRTMSSAENCFDCHRFDTYANNNASDAVKNYSRFGAQDGHGKHVGEQQRPCYACHETHGQPTQTALIVTGRNPGINSYTPTASGGSCSPTCHDPQSYTVSYPR